jgi:hypothetical protein
MHNGDEDMDAQLARHMGGGHVSGAVLISGFGGTAV